VVEGRRAVPRGEKGKGYTVLFWVEELQQGADPVLRLAEVEAVVRSALRVDAHRVGAVEYDDDVELVHVGLARATRGTLRLDRPGVLSEQFREVGRHADPGGHADLVGSRATRILAARRHGRLDFRVVVLRRPVAIDVRLHIGRRCAGVGKFLRTGDQRQVDGRLQAALVQEGVSDVDRQGGDTE
jgi:hypothetical protein